MPDSDFSAPGTDAIVDVAVIGAGMAGLAAGVFAVNRGLSAARLGSTGDIAYTTGYLDILGFPHDGCAPCADPRAAVAELLRGNPDHPYGKTAWEDIEGALAEFMDFLAEAGLPYVRRDSNLTALSPMGTAKTTRAVPVTMLPGVDALARRDPCLLIDFIGLKAFSAKGIAAVLKHTWPSVTPLGLLFPDAWAGELYPEAMARALEVPDIRKALAESIRPHLGGARCVGFPAVLGITGSAAVQGHLAELLGVPVFEIPTLPPGVPGIRLRENLDDVLRAKGLMLFSQRYAFGIRKEGGVFHVIGGESGPEFTIRARSVVLATGRFLSGGLVADRVDGISEPLCGLFVKQPASREEWHKEDFFDPGGHPVNRAGIRTDADFRPLDGRGNLVDPDIYAVGSILADHDWVREKSGAGIALASAWKAVATVARKKEAV